MFVYGLCSVIFPLQTISFFDVMCDLRELGVFDNSGNKNIHFKHHMLSSLPDQAFFPPLYE